MCAVDRKQLPKVSKFYSICNTCVMQKNVGVDTTLLVSLRVNTSSCLRGNTSSYQILLFMFTFHNNLLPKSLLSTFALDIKKNSDFHSYNTRASSHYRSQYARINTSLFSFVCTGPILWNRLPNTLKNTYTLASFKRNLKKYLNA